MKKFFLILIFLFMLPLSISQNQLIKDSKIEYFVNDYANLLTNQEIREIESVLQEIYEKGLAEYAVVIINSLEGQDIESFSYNLAEGKLGNKEKNNGLLLLVALQDRKYRFEVGRGLEPVLPDIIMARIGRNYLEPNFKKGKYANGILESSYAIRDILLNNTESEYFVAKKNDGLITGLIIFIILIIIVVFIITIASKSTKPIKRRDDDYFFAGFLLSDIIKNGKNKGGFSGSNSFGGFGGGSFGGGGSSGRW